MNARIINGSELLLLLLFIIPQFRAIKFNVIMMTKKNLILVILIYICNWYINY